LKTERIALLFRHIVAHGRLDPGDPQSDDVSGGNWHRSDKADSESNYDLALTQDAFEDLISIMRELRTDHRIAAHVEYEVLEKAVIKAIAQAAAAFDHGVLDEKTIVNEVVKLLTQDVRDWHVVIPVPGLDVIEGASIDVAGIQMGSLTPEEYRRLVQLGEDWGSTMRLRAEAEVGSAAEHCKQRTQALLSEGKGSWAWGTVNSTEETLDRTVYERVYEVALNILRCFTPAFRENPEKLSLGQPEFREIDKRVAYLEADPRSSFRLQHSRFSDRHPLALSQDSLEYLKTHAGWNRAQAICATVERTDLEDAMYRAMLQFGTTTTIAPLEVRLAGYLTTLEAILLGDDDYSHHDTKIARRLSALTGFNLLEDIPYLYRARQGPVHRAERNLAGRVVVLAEAVDNLRFTVYQALMAILDPPASLYLPADLRTRRELHLHLDSMIQLHDATSRQYAFVVRPSEDDGGFEASCPDFPGCEGAGTSEAIAQDRARVAVSAAVRRLVESGENLPIPGDVKVNRLTVWVPTEQTDVEAYLASTKEMEHEQRQKFRHIKGGTRGAEQAARLGGVPVNELEEKRRKGLIIGLPNLDASYDYPVWQFQDGQLVPDFEDVLIELGTTDPWAQAAFMLDFNCGESRPIEELLQGHVDRVRHEARRVKRQGDAWLPVTRPLPIRVTPDTERKSIQMQGGEETSSKSE